VTPFCNLLGRPRFVANSRKDDDGVPAAVRRGGLTMNLTKDGPSLRAGAPLSSSFVARHLRAAEGTQRSSRLGSGQTSPSQANCRKGSQHQ